MAVGKAREGSSRVPRTPNNALRNVRENERHETRAEFAEAMARIARETGTDVYPDWKYVERLESSDIMWPGPAYRKILETLCGRPAWQLGFTPPAYSGSGPADDPGESSAHVNVELRDAVWAKGMEVTEFARKIGVDSKTAERWITQGRIPRPRHRWEASQILGRDESELWPDASVVQEKPPRAPRKVSTRRKPATP